MFVLKQQTAYDMRISDWSSDVRSSDLQRLGLWLDHARLDALAAQLGAQHVAALGLLLTLHLLAALVRALPEEHLQCHPVAYRLGGTARGGGLCGGTCPGHDVFPLRPQIPDSPELSATRRVGETV